MAHRLLDDRRPLLLVALFMWIFGLPGVTVSLAVAVAVGVAVAAHVDVAVATAAAAAVVDICLNFNLMRRQLLSATATHKSRLFA